MYPISSLATSRGLFEVRGRWDMGLGDYRGHVGQGEHGGL